MYDDNYKSCSETYITLRIYFAEFDSEKMTNYLGIQPSSFQNKNDETKNYKINGWFLSSENKLVSKDCRRHIDFIVEMVLPIIEKIEFLKNAGAKIDLCCYWLSKNGNGGPTLSKKQTDGLAKIGLDFWFDIY